MAVICDYGDETEVPSFVSLNLPAGYSNVFSNYSPETEALERCFGAFTELRFWVGITHSWIHLKVSGHNKGILRSVECEFLGVHDVVHTTPTGGSVRLRRMPTHDMIILDLL